MPDGQDNPRDIAEVTVNGDVTAKLAGEQDHEHGVFGIEFYDADGAFVGHAELSDELVNSVAQTAYTSLYSGETTLATTQADAASQMSLIAASCVVISISLFIILGSICVSPLIKSLGLRK